MTKRYAKAKPASARVVLSRLHFANFAKCAGDKNSDTINKWARESVEEMSNKSYDGLFAWDSPAKAGDAWLPVTREKYEDEFMKLFNKLVQ